METSATLATAKHMNSLPSRRRFKRWLGPMTCQFSLSVCQLNRALRQ
jgi:hypothetical protein